MGVLDGDVASFCAFEAFALILLAVKRLAVEDGQATHDLMMQGSAGRCRFCSTTGSSCTD